MKQAEKIPVSIEDWSGSYAGRIIPFIGISVAFHALVLAVLFSLIMPHAGGGPGSSGTMAAPGHQELTARDAPLIAGFEAPVRKKVFPIDYFREVIPWSPSPVVDEVPALPETGFQVHLVGNVTDLNVPENRIPATIVPDVNAVETGNNLPGENSLITNGNPGEGSEDGTGSSGEGTSGFGEGNGGYGNGIGGYGTGTGGNGDINSIERTGIGLAGENPESNMAGENQPETPEFENDIDIESLLAQYIESVKAAVKNAKSYPQMSQRLRETGSAQINFTVAANGELTSVSVAESSGYDRLDQAAVEAVRAAAPFDPVPPETGLETLSMSITLIFELN